MQWYLKDEEDRGYALSVLASLRDNEAIVPLLWAYEVSNALVTAHRRKRLSVEEVPEILTSLSTLPIQIDRPEPESVMELASLALEHGPTVYDAAYLGLALRLGLPLASKDGALRQAMEKSGVRPV